MEIQYCRVRVGLLDENVWMMPVLDLKGCSGEVPRNGIVSAQCHGAGGRILSRGIGV